MVFQLNAKEILWKTLFTVLFFSDKLLDYLNDCRLFYVSFEIILSYRYLTIAGVFFLFVCLFVCLFGVAVPLENFSLIWRRHHYRRRAANFDLCSAPMAMGSEGSLACHTSCDTGHPFKMVISEDPWHTYCRAFSGVAVTTCFYDLGLLRLGFEHPTFRLRLLYFKHISCKVMMTASFCLFVRGVFWCPSREFFNHMETSTLQILT